ncbi:hypothetical protein [Mesorhizobium sp. M0578]|uniref:hypothetical protein n=1 Tax=unclassified Mesorhizobium TaxID=325217 RepID=UPI003334BA70
MNLQTKRLVLLSATPENLEPLARINDDSEWLSMSQSLWIEVLWQLGLRANASTSRSSNTALGYWSSLVRLNGLSSVVLPMCHIKRTSRKRLTLSGGSLRPVEGRGYATEAALVPLAFGFGLQTRYGAAGDDPQPTMISATLMARDDPLQASSAVPDQG